MDGKAVTPSIDEFIKTINKLQKEIKHCNINNKQYVKMIKKKDEEIKELKEQNEANNTHDSCCGCDVCDPTRTLKEENKKLKAQVKRNLERNKELKGFRSVCDSLSLPWLTDDCLMEYITKLKKENKKLKKDNTKLEEKIICLESDSHNEVSQAQFDDAMEDKDEEIKKLKKYESMIYCVWTDVHHATFNVGKTISFKDIAYSCEYFDNEEFIKKEVIDDEEEDDEEEDDNVSEDEDNDFDEPSECMSCDKKFCMFAASQGFHKLSYNKYFGSNQDDGDLCEKCILKVEYEKEVDFIDCLEGVKKLFDSDKCE